MDKLKQKRSSIKSSITRIHNYCSDPNAAGHEIGVRVEKLESYFNAFEEIQDEIEFKSTTDEQHRAEEDQRAHVEGQYYAIKAIYHSRIHEDNTSNETVVDTSNQQLVSAVETIARNQSTLGEIISRISTNASSTPTTIQPPHIHRDSIKLPRIQLPNFDGTITEWIRFRDLFEATVHNNENLAKIEKFEYLLCHVKADALSVIKHLRPSNDNYEVGWELMKKKFDDMELIKKNYLKIIFDQPSMKDSFADELKRLINNTNESVNALQTLKEHVNQWGSVIIFHLERKLDMESQTLWCRNAIVSPTLTQFLEFLTKRLRELENKAENNHIFKQPFIKQPFLKNKSISNVHASTVKECTLCNQQHPLYFCENFKALDVNERIKVVRTNNMCFNCFGNDHLAPDCKRSTCRICNNKHNTLLHKQETSQQSTTAHLTEEQVDIHTVSSKHQQNITLLPTAVAMIRDQHDELQPCRMLLDTGAQVSLITERCVQRLNLKKSFDNTVLCGVGEIKGNCARGKVQINLKSAISDQTLTTEALCLPRLTQNQPSHQIPITTFKYFKNLVLADKEFNVPGSIDVILGADTFDKWFLNVKIVHPSGSPTAISTIFGWTIIGKTSIEQASCITIAHASIDLSNQLQIFWEVKELHEPRKYFTNEKQQAELHYQKTVSRVADGRYMASLPVKSHNIEFGNSLIINIIPAQYWQHIKVSQNPADVATRRSTPAELAQNDLWWYGTQELTEPEYQKSDKRLIQITSLEKRANTTLHVISNQMTTFLEFYSNFNKLNRITALVLQFINNCLNSRPLSAKFEGDQDPLTPAHFLILKSMQTLPEKDYTNIKFNRLTSWQHLQKLVQSFWKTWSTDYLRQLQTRQKWKRQGENVKKDDIVLFINDQTPPSKWSIGRVIDTHPGLDGLVRVATIKTQSGQYKRPISKLCPLLVDI